jgi:hypothetical protein
VEYFEKLNFKKEINFSNPDFLINCIEKAQLNSKEHELIINNGRDIQNNEDEEIKDFEEKKFVFFEESYLDNMSFNTSFFTQFYYLSKRALKNFILNPYLFPFQLFCCILM